MMDTEVLNKLRAFLKEELMKEQVEFLSLGDELELDSLDQTELRVFLSEEFGINTTFESVPVEKLTSLSNIMSLITEPKVA